MSSLLDEIRESVLQETTGEELVCDLMKDVIEEATELMINKHLDRVAVPYTVRCVTREMLDFIHCAFVGQDRGDVRTDGWMGGRNPEAIAVDSWARGAVDIKVKPRAAASDSQNKSQNHQQDSALLGATSRLRPKGSNVSSNQLDKKLSKRDGASAEGARGDSQLGDKSKSTLSRQSVKGRNGSKAGSSSTKVGGDSAKGGGDSNGEGGADGEGGESGGLDGSGVQLSQEEVDYSNKIKAEQKKRHETKLLSDRLSKQMEEMKNVKDIVVDGATGKVIAVRQFDGRPTGNEKNTRKVELKFQVNADVEPVSQAQAKPVARRAGGAPGASTGGGGGGGRKRNDGSAFVQEENQHGPMIEGVMPSGGVVVKEGDATRRSDLKVPKTKLSRAEYKKMVDTVQVNIDPDGLGGDNEENGGENGGKTKIGDNPNITNISPKDSNARAAEELKKKESQMRRQSMVGGSSSGAQQQQQQQEFKSQKAAKLPAHNIASAKVGGGVIGAKARGGHGKDLKLEATVKSQAIDTVHDLEERDKKGKVSMTILQESYFDDDGEEEQQS